MTARTDLTRPAMGTTVRVLVEGPDQIALDLAAERAFAVVDRHERLLSRFRPDSELSRLNADPRTVVPATAVLRSFVAAAREAGERTRGLVDATLLAPLERAGYAESRKAWPGGLLEEVLRAAPQRAPARPDPGARWRLIAAPPETGVVSRPPGVRLDSGGVAKGLAAGAAVAALGLTGVPRAVIDCGGDLAVVAREGAPWEIGVEHQLPRPDRRRAVAAAAHCELRRVAARRRARARRGQRRLDLADARAAGGFLGGHRGAPGHPGNQCLP